MRTRGARLSLRDRHRSRSDDVEVRVALTDPLLEGIILCPSNPDLSIAPILALRGMRDLLADARAPIIAVSPLIAGAAVKGPAAKIMRELDLPVSPLEIARQYGDFLDLMLIDETDAQLLGTRKAGDPAIAAASILMRTPDDRRALATVCLERLPGLLSGGLKPDGRYK